MARSPMPYVQFLVSAMVCVFLIGLMVGLRAHKRQRHQMLDIEAAGPPSEAGDILPNSQEYDTLLEDYNSDTAGSEKDATNTRGEFCVSVFNLLHLFVSVSCNSDSTA